MIFLSCNPKEPDLKKVKNLPHSNARFVGDEACMECHSEQNKLWQGSHHAQSMMEASDSTVLADFSGSFFESSGMKSTFFMRDSNYLVYTEGPDGNYDTFKIEYTFGVTPLQQYLVKTTGGRMQALRTAWDTEKNEWFDLYEGQNIIPQDWLHWTRGGLNWNTMCAECHSTNLDKNFDYKTLTYDTRYDLINVSCESCHGPASSHIEWANNVEKGEDYSLRLTTGTYFDDQIRTCAPCHMRKTNLTEKLTFEGELLNDFVPQILTDNLYHSDGQILDEVYVYGSFIQSKMYANGVKCSDCHDPHSLQLRFEGNNLCIQCHESNYDSFEHTFHKKGTEGASCIDCHMDGNTYMGVDYRRDHSFRIPRPDQSLDYGTPNACMDCHSDKGNEWAAEQIENRFGKERKFHFSDILAGGRSRQNEWVEPLGKLLGDSNQPSIARATAAYYLGDIHTPESFRHLTYNLSDSSSLVRNYILVALQSFPGSEKYNYAMPLLKDSIKAVRLSAATILTDLNSEQIPASFIYDFNKVDKELEISLQNQLDFPVGQFQMAQYKYRKGDIESARKYYRRALSMDTLLHVARENLARIYNAEGRNEIAIDLLKTTLHFDPENEQANYSLGLIYAEMENLTESIHYLKKVVSINELNERAHYNLSLAYQHQQKTKESESAYLNGLKYLPDSFILRNGLTILYIQQNQKDLALKQIEYLEKNYPGNQQVIQLRQAFTNL